MAQHSLQFALWVAGAIQTGIVLVNAALPSKLRVREGTAAMPSFLRQVFIVHWIYIVLMVALFSALSFAFTRDLAGATTLGRFLSATIALFWLLRLLLQVFFYDPQLRRENRALDLVYNASLIVLAAIFGFAAIHPLA